jgi:proteasome lid subunit RPN8/RPN11
MLPKNVVVHPTVLLSITDHHSRIGLHTRAVGALLGTVSGGVVDVTNCFAVPFAEDKADATAWFLDHQYLSAMAGMFRRVDACEKIVGWYSTGPKLRRSDTLIHAVIAERAHVSTPVYVIVDTRPRDLVVPTHAYALVCPATEEEARPTAKSELPPTPTAMPKIADADMDGDEGAVALAPSAIADSPDVDVLIRDADRSGALQPEFVHLPSTVGSIPVEDIGVEHLLRGVSKGDPALTGAVKSLRARQTSLETFRDTIDAIVAYLRAGLAGDLPAGRKISPEIVALLQTTISRHPDLSAPELAGAITASNAATASAAYVAALTRQVVALHEVVDNHVEFAREASKRDATTKTRRTPPVPRVAPKRATAGF